MRKGQGLLAVLAGAFLWVVPLSAQNALPVVTPAEAGLASEPLQERSDAEWPARVLRKSAAQLASDLDGCWS